MAKQPHHDDEQEAKEAEIVIEYQLAEPINAYGEEIKVLKLRKPTGMDLIEIGNPVDFYPYAEPVKVAHDMPKVRAMLARLANIPSSSVARLGPRDLVGLAWAISPFFIPAP
jgi:hypothetical protein